MGGIIADPGGQFWTPITPLRGSIFSADPQQGNAGAERAANETELQRVLQQIERLVDALVNGTPASAVNVRLQKFEARRLELEALLAAAVPEIPRLHRALPELYRTKVANLIAAMDGDDAAAARELVRGLVEQITLSPDGESGHRVEVRGELSAILALAGTGVSRNTATASLSGGMPVAGQPKGPGVSAGAYLLSEQVKLVAGTGFEPVTFRL